MDELEHRVNQADPEGFFMKWLVKLLRFIAAVTAHPRADYIDD